MLTEVADPRALIVELGLDAPHDWIFVSAVVGMSMTLLADNPADPRVLIAHEGARFMFHFVGGAGSRARHPAAAEGGVSPDALRTAFTFAARDLLTGAVDQPGGWPSAATRAAWDSEGRPYIFIDTSPLESWQGCVDAGLLAHPESNDHVADLLWWAGPPRLSRHISHSCRLGRGQELWDRLRQGIGYDPEGHYIRRVLERMPSYVCEVGGAPVCWSTQHLNGSMGMIYTPEEHRRRGYARSLAAFQIDHNLRVGTSAIGPARACCHVVRGNTASETMLRELDGSSADQRIVWRSVHWPE